MQNCNDLANTATLNALLNLANLAGLLIIAITGMIKAKTVFQELLNSSKRQEVQNNRIVQTIVDGNENAKNNNDAH